MAIAKNGFSGIIEGVVSKSEALDGTLGTEVAGSIQQVVFDC
jgi:hypothetical protein